MSTSLRALSGAIKTALDAAARALGYANVADVAAKAATKAVADVGTQADAVRVIVANVSDVQTDVTAKANTATTQAGIATTQAGIATTKAGEAAGSATAAQTAQALAEAARDAANTSARAYTSAQGTAAALADAGVTTGQSFSVLAADLQTYTVYRKDAGPVATLLYTQYTKGGVDSVMAPIAKRADGVAAQALRLRDASGRMILEVSADAAVGITPRVPVNLPAGTVTTPMLDAPTQARLPTALSDAITGYVLRIKDTAGRLVFGVPADGSRPIAAYVSRAATADTGGSVVTETATYYVEAFADGSGIMQLRARRKTDNQTVWTTAGAASSSSPTSTADGKVLYVKSGAVYSVDPTDGVSYPALPSTDLVMYGDSMTAPGSGYGATLAALYPARAAYNMGQGGQRTAGIAVRFGVPGLTLAVTGNAIPTAGSVPCTPNIPMLPNPGTNTLRCVVGGVECDLKGVDGVYTLTPVVYPGAPVALANPAPAVIVSGYVAGASAALAPRMATMQTGVVIIRAGKNDVTKVDYDKAATLAWIAAMVDAVKSRAKAVLVLGVTNGYNDLTVARGGVAASEAQSQQWLANVDDFNTTLAGIYGARYLDPLANHVALGGSTLQNVNGQDFQVLNASILSDGIHENATGWARTAALVQSAINAKGY